MTRQELGDRVGVTRRTVNAIETDKYSPSLERVFRSPEHSACRWEEVFTWGEEG